jgi:hypothetical protein
LASRGRRHPGTATGHHPARVSPGIHAGERPPRAATPLHHKHEQKRPQESRTTYTTDLSSTNPLRRNLNSAPSHLRSSTETQLLSVNGDLPFLNERYMIHAITAT